MIEEDKFKVEQLTPEERAAFLKLDSLKLFQGLFNGSAEHPTESMCEIQIMLIHYLSKLLGNSSRQQAKEFSKMLYPKSISHEIVNQNIQKGELYFSQLYNLVKLIEINLLEKEALMETLPNLAIFTAREEVEEFEKAKQEKESKGVER